MRVHAEGLRATIQHTSSGLAGPGGLGAGGMQRGDGLPEADLGAKDALQWTGRERRERKALPRQKESGFVKRMRPEVFRA